MKESILVQKGMCVAVMGFGVTGRAAVRYCLNQGAAVKVSDTRSKEDLLTEFEDYFKAKDIQWEAGGHSVEFLKSADLVVVSPGISLTEPVIKDLQAMGIPIAGELAVAAPHLTVPTAAITGTNGKTTVTSLLGHILKTAGKRTFVGGNIGTPLLDHLESGSKAEYLVLEVSSFQIETAGTFSPDIGIVLNIMPDHLDRHHSLDEYAAVKLGMLRNRGAGSAAVLYGDDERCRAALDTLKGKVLTFGADRKNSAVVDGTKIELVTGDRPEIYELAGSALGTAIGARNSAAAILAARYWGISREDIQKGLSTFPLLPHRMELVGELGGVSFVNDSKATNTGAVIAALEQIDGQAVLIAGGKDKGDDYSLLCDLVRKKVRLVVLIGEASAKIGAELAGCTRVFAAEDMESAVRAAYENAHKGDTVLLSPACASFDMFDSYAHRGRVFTGAVARLIEQSGKSQRAVTNG